MENKYLHRAHLKEGRIILATVGILIAILMPSINRSRYLKLLSYAESSAVREYGDKKEPFTNEERIEWYNALGVDTRNPKAEPTRSQLEKYVEAKYIEAHKDKRTQVIS